MNTALATTDTQALAPQQSDDMFAVIMKAARDDSFDIERLDKLIQMKERMDAQNRKERFDEALRQCQMAMPRVEKNGTVKTRTGDTIYAYAKLEDFDTSIRAIYQKHGFTVTYDAPMSTDGGKIRSVARFSCAGHTEALEITAAPSNRSAGNITLTDAQKVKQTITECRRHLLEMFFNIITIGADENIDVRPISADQEVQLLEMIESVGANKPNFLRYMGVEKLTDILTRDFDRAMNALKQKAKR